MNADLVNFLVSFSSGLAANISTDALKMAYQQVFKLKPDLEHRLLTAEVAADKQAAVNELASALEALAGTGAIGIDGAIINALRSATFDHQDGEVLIDHSTISAPLLSTGGTGRGTTKISGNSELKSAGTSIKLTGSASIIMTGNAGIKQS